jgi:DNA-binding transcriptional MerR regulator
MMENINKIIEALELENKLALEEIPNIDLYMDQVIQLFENKFTGLKRNANDKILTKTMINNYAKGKLFFPIKNKKYSKEHLILISLIYQLKGVLSINDIKETLGEVNEKVIKGGLQLDDFYNGYLNLTTKNIEYFKKDIQERAKEVDEEIVGMEDPNSVHLEKVLMIASLAHISNLYRRTAEKLVDEIMVERPGKGHK